MVTQKEEPVFDDLRRHLDANDVLVDGIVAMDSAVGDRGLFASRQLAPEQTVLRIPNSMLITGESARSSPVVTQIAESVRKSNLKERLPDVETDVAAITLYLLLEQAKGEGSDLHTWFRTLPDRFVTPLTADEDDVHEMLTGSPVLYMVMRLREELREMYDLWVVPFGIEAHPDSFPADVCTFERFMYVHSVCDSRSFLIDGVSVLAPFADMANHRTYGSSDVNLRVRGFRMADRPDELGMEMYVSSLEPVKAGEELCISYGTLSSGQLLTHYGFVLPDNPADCLPISLDFPEGDSVRVHTKKQILMNVDSKGLLSLHHELTDKEPLPAGLLASTRLLLMDEAEIEPVTMHSNFGEQISRKIEDKVKSQLGSLFQSMLDEYAEPVDVDGLKKDSLEMQCALYMGITTGIIRKALAAVQALP